MKKNIKKMLLLAKPFRIELTIGVIAMITLTLINIGIPLIMRRMTQELEQYTGETGVIVLNMNFLLYMGALLVMAYVTRGAFRFIASYIPHRASWHMVTNLRATVYNKLQNLPASYFSNQQTGQLMSRVVNDTDRFELMVAHIIPDTFVSILTFISVVTILLFIQPTLTLLVFIPVPFIIIAGIIFMKKIRPAFRKAQENLGIFNGALQENLSGFKEIQSFSKQITEHNKIAGLSNAHAYQLIKTLKYSAVFHALTEFITSLGTIVVVVFGGYLVMTTNYFTIADIFVFLLYLSLFYAPIQTLSRILEDYQSAWAGANRVFEVLETESDIIEKPDATELTVTNGEIVFNKVGFSYVDEVEVLANLDFTIEPKSFVALVGPTGVGKTTLINLIMRFYDPIEGHLDIDGVDIKDVTLNSLRSNVSVVLQDIFLFNGTIEENIRYSYPSATTDDIINAAKLAQIHEFIINLPNGYDTIVGERGIRLSGGQKQRMSIARAVLRKSPILILDEATSSIDAETEAEIQKSINALKGSCTIIVIAHRLSTIRKADTIYVLDNGQIVESGTHEELVGNDGIYKKLCDKQIV